MRKDFGLTGTALLICVGATLVFGVARARQDNVNDECVGNVLVLAKALVEYAQDYDENFPPTMTGSAFRGELAPYVRPFSPTRFYCPATRLLYSTNTRFAGQELAKLNLPDASRVPLFWDPRPHRDGKLTVAFLDGHVERGGVDVVDPNDRCVDNVRDLSTSMILYAQDYDGLLPPMTTPNQFKAADLAYAHSARNFVCPATHLPYTPNAALSETPFNAYPNPANVVVLSDARPHLDGKSTFGYLDGHAVRK